MMKSEWDYEEYSQWAKKLAKDYTRDEIIEKMWGANINRRKLADSHRKAIEKSTSMQSQSQTKAQGRNKVVGNYEEYKACRDALEIIIFYPEKSKEQIHWKDQFYRAIVEAYMAGGGNQYMAMEYFIQNYC